jgi:hypothetical protein
LPEETERLHALQSIYNQLALLEQEAKHLQSDDPALFTGIPVDPEVLQLEHEFKLLQQGGILQVQLQVELSEEESDQSEDDIALPCSVASIDSIAENADFVYL